MALSQNSPYLTAVSYISVVIAGTALILNVIGIYLIRKQESQRTYQNLIILNLNVIQIPISIGANAYWISVLTHGTGSKTLLRWTTPMWISARITLIFIIAIVTFDRLFAIKYSLRYLIIVSKRMVKLALSAIWLSWFVGFSVLKSMGTDIYFHVIIVLIVPISEFLLLCFILCTYFYIFWRIRKRRKILKDSSANPQQVQYWNKQALRVSTAIILSYIMFVVLPDFTDSILQPIIKGEAWEKILLTAYMLDTCYYVALPVTYIFLHRDTRRMFLENVVRCCSKKGDISNSAIVLKDERLRVNVI